MTTEEVATLRQSGYAPITYYHQHTDNDGVDDSNGEHLFFAVDIATDM